MATRERLEQALRNAHAAGDTAAASRLAAAIRNGEYDDAPQAAIEAQEQQEQPGMMRQNLEQASNIFDEFRHGLGRGIAGTVDAAQSLTPAGAATNVGRMFGAPGMPNTLSDYVDPMLPGGQMGDGMAGRIVGGVGEIIPGAVGGGGVMRAIGKGIAESATGMGAKMLRGMGASTPASDVGYGAASVVGGEVGREVGGDAGAITGALVTPFAAAGGGLVLGNLLQAGKRGIDAIGEATKGMSDDGAAMILAEAMVREGMTPDDVVARMAQMGDQGMLADVGPEFARRLRLAANHIPKLQGMAGKKLAERQAGQADRLASAFDDAAGTPMLSLDDEIARLDNATKGPITELYQQAKEAPLKMSPRLKAMMEGDNSVGRAAKEAQKNLADYRAAGEELGNMALIDETKKVLDAQISKAIRDGDRGAVSRLTTLKNTMVAEADAASPAYAQARSMFAGKQQLKNAAEVGEQFFKTSKRELTDIVSSFGESERRMYKLGAKQAILDKFDDAAANADLVNRVFGKRGMDGELGKMRTLFDSSEEFQKFRDALQLEANWKVTMREALGNSTTAKQLADDQAMNELIGESRRILSNPLDAAMAAGKIVAGIESGGSAKTKALMEAGTLLLETGADPEAVKRILKSGEATLMRKAIDNHVKRYRSSLPVVPASLGARQQETQDQASRMPVVEIPRAMQ